MSEQAFVSVFPADIDHNVLAVQVQNILNNTSNGIDEMSVIMGARVATFNPDATETSDWGAADSEIVQGINEVRFRNFLRKAGVDNPKIFNGGQSPRTIIKPHIHIKEWEAFKDYIGSERSQLLPGSELANKMMEKPFHFISGSPFTPLYNTFLEYPEASTNLKGIYAMHATWGNVQLMDLNADGAKRGALQFNVACDPPASKFVVDAIQTGAINAPLYLGTAECTRVKELGFRNYDNLASFLPKTAKSEAVLYLYKTWYEKAVRPRQEKSPDELLFIHNVIAGFLFEEEKRNALYEIVPVKVEVPQDSENLGKMYLTEVAESNIYATARLKDGADKLYMQYLYEMFL